jgi:hypothetical protein
MLAHRWTIGLGLVLVAAALGWMATPVAEASTGPACCPGEVIYCNAPCACGAVYKTVVVVCHPCTGCQIPVELCLPACCAGEPCVVQRPTLLGCGLTRYTWGCGHGATIRFLRCGDVKVRYF